MLDPLERPDEHAELVALLGVGHADVDSALTKAGERRGHQDLPLGDCRVVEAVRLVAARDGPRAVERGGRRAASRQCWTVHCQVAPMRRRQDRRQPEQPLCPQSRPRARAGATPCRERRMASVAHLGARDQLIERRVIWSCQRQKSSSCGVFDEGDWPE